MSAELRLFLPESLNVEKSKRERFYLNDGDSAPLLGFDEGFSFQGEKEKRRKGYGRVRVVYAE